MRNLSMLMALGLTGCGGAATSANDKDAAAASDGAGDSARLIDGAGGANLPAWVSALPLWQWHAIPGTALSSVEPNPKPAFSPSSKITAWNGATLKRAGSIYMLGAAGGHSDYSGNEVDALALNTETPKWVELRGPSASADVINGPAQFYLDHRPSDTHTYYATQFIESRNRMFVMASPGISGSFPAPPDGWAYNFDAAATRSYSFNLDTNDWDSPDYVALYTGGGDFTAGMTVKNPVTDDIYMARNGGGWWKWAAASNTWTRYGNKYSYETNYAGAAVDPTRSRILVAGDYNGMVAPRVHNFDSSAVAATFGGLGADALKMHGYPGMVYDEANDTFLTFVNDGDWSVPGHVIEVLRVDAGTWSVDAPAVTGNKPDARQNGIQNSVQYVPELRGVVIANSYTGDVQFMRTSL